MVTFLHCVSTVSISLCVDMLACSIWIVLFRVYTCVMCAGSVYILCHDSFLQFTSLHCQFFLFVQFIGSVWDPSEIDLSLGRRDISPVEED